LKELFDKAVWSKKLRTAGDLAVQPLNVAMKYGR
jgi:hypothetical protein